jgi:hypothetical protein
MKTLIETNSEKKLYVYDSFQGLPELSEWEKNTGWRAGTLKSSEEILISNFERNNLPLPIIHKDWFKDVPSESIPDKISFAFLDGDFYDSIYDSLEKIYERVSDGGYILFHDYKRNDLPGVKGAIDDFFRERNIDGNVIEVCEQLGLYRKNYKVEESVVTEKKTGGLTLVTGLWDIKRDLLTEGWNRSFEEHYLTKFNQLLDVEENMIIFGDESLKEFVFRKRNLDNTLFITRNLDWFKNNDYYDKIQKIRLDENWSNLAPWLKESTQARLEYYNPLVMSKVFLLNDAKILDKFDSDFLFWIDAGLTNTVHPGYFTKDKVFNKLEKYVSKFSFVCFPYEANQEIHGFEFNKINDYAGRKVEKVARGGFFGLPKHTISEINTIYYGLLMDSLNEGYMGTEESIFSIMCYKHSDLINYFDIEGNGLVGKFFEDLKNDNLKVKNDSPVVSVSNLDTNKVGLYVITFNSPKQFKTLIDSFLAYDKDYLYKTEKFLLDNSSDSSTYEEYSKLCSEYNFTHIKKDNLGICGGRQFIAEHFKETDLDFYLFFEDDMFFYPKQGEVCRNGFNRFVPNLYTKSLEIMKKENFDFLKLNYTEFFGDNGTQWSWYNVPQEVRYKFWPNNPKLPKMGLDPNAPKTKYESVLSHKGLPYVTGDVYYCNWPQIVSRYGNEKMFLETTWAHPFEQTWMSHMYQKTKEGVIKPGLLLLTPTEHNRFEHYDKDLRKES